MVERRYAMTKLGAGDYLLPSNDGRVIWRITRDATPDDGWAVYRYAHSFTDGGALDTYWEDDCGTRNWVDYAFGFKTRQAAVDAALEVTP